jgi:hypothetical protein
LSPSVIDPFALGRAKYAESLTDGAFENGPLGVTACENPQPHHRGQEQPRRVGGAHVRRYAAVALASDNASAKECLQFAHALRHDLGNVRVMRRHLQCGVGQEATESTFKRALNYFGQKGFDCLTWWQYLFDARNAGPHIRGQIVVKALCEERPLVAERVVDAGLAKTHGVSKIAHRGGRISGSPKALHGRLQRSGFVEFTRAGQA